MTLGLAPVSFFAGALPSAVVADSAPAVTVGLASRISNPAVAAVMELTASLSGADAGGPIGAKLGNGAGIVLALICGVAVVAKPRGAVADTCPPSVMAE